VRQVLFATRRVAVLGIETNRTGRDRHSMGCVSYHTRMRTRYRFLNA